MDVLLQHHNAKHVADIPDGLPELCADISREVIRSEPDDIYSFIADYLSTLLITRENAKVAIKIVQSVTLKSEHIVEILLGTGLRLCEIAAVAPRLQKAFKVYLDAVDEQKKECGCDADDSDIDDEQEISICQILRVTGVSYPDAQRAAIRIQALFRGHQQRMTLAEGRGEVQWQRAAANTVALLRRTGVTRAEATRAAIIIQAAYRGYYTRKNLKLQRARDGKQPFDWCAWYRMMYEECGITPQRAQQAATVIQVAYREHKKKKSKQEWDFYFSIDAPVSSDRKEDNIHEEPKDDHPGPIKSEAKSELQSQSEISHTESDLNDIAKTTTEVTESSEEQAQTEESTKVEDEQPETTDAQADDDVEQVVDVAEDKIEKPEEEVENKDAEIKEAGTEEENNDAEEVADKDAEIKERDEEKPNETAEE